QYDANSNAILSIDRQRFHDAVATGALNNPTTDPKARVYYVAGYFDAIDRQTDTVDVGTNGGSAYTRPAASPRVFGTATSATSNTLTDNNLNLPTGTTSFNNYTLRITSGTGAGQVRT